MSQLTNKYCWSCAFFEIGKFCNLCTSNIDNYKPKEGVVGDKYCVAGKICCENIKYGFTIPVSCMETTLINGFEQCPWPSKQKKVKDKYEKAYEYYRDNTTYNQIDLRCNFIEACKKAELK